MSTVLVTGATGLLGSNLVRGLLEAGKKVRVTVRSRSRMDAIEGLDVEKVTADVTDQDSTASALNGISEVYHCAAIWKTALGPGENRLMMSVNIEGTRNVLRESVKAGVRKLVHVSSTAVYRPGAKPGMIDESFPYQRQDIHPYVHSKVESEKLALSYNNEGIDVVVVQPGGILGEHDYYGNTTYSTLIYFAKSPKCMIFRGMLPLVLATDAAQAMITAMEKAPGGSRYLLAGHNATMESILNAVSSKLGTRPKVRKIPLPAVRAVAKANQKAFELMGRKPDLLPYDIELTQCMPGYSSASALKELDFSPSNLKEIIDRSIDWLERVNYFSYQT